MVSGGRERERDDERGFERPPPTRSTELYNPKVIQPPHNQPHPKRPQTNSSRSNSAGDRERDKEKQQQFRSDMAAIEQQVRGIAVSSPVAGADRSEQQIS